MFLIQGHIFLKKFPADWVIFFENSKIFKKDGGTVAAILREKKRSDEQYSVVCSTEQTFYQRSRGRMKERMPILQEFHCVILPIALSTALFLKQGKQYNNTLILFFLYQKFSKK